MKIEPGQIYYSANSANNNRRVRVVTRCFGKIAVYVLDADGNDLRFRQINTDQFHATMLTRDGNSRRRGYILEK